MKSRDYNCNLNYLPVMTSCHLGVLQGEGGLQVALLEAQYPHRPARWAVTAGAVVAVTVGAVVVRVD